MPNEAYFADQEGNKMDINEIEALAAAEDNSTKESVPTVDTDLNFTEFNANPSEVSQEEEDKAAIEAIRKTLKNSADVLVGSKDPLSLDFTATPNTLENSHTWDGPEQDRAGYN